MPQRTSDPEFPAGLLPDLVRAANSRGSSLVMGAYAPLDPDDVEAASAGAAAAAASAGASASASASASGHSGQSLFLVDDYLAGRLERFAQDLLDGGQSRLKQRDREQALAHNDIKERRRGRQSPNATHTHTHFFKKPRLVCFFLTFLSHPTTAAKTVSVAWCDGSSDERIKNKEMSAVDAPARPLNIGKRTWSVSAARGARGRG